MLNDMLLHLLFLLLLVQDKFLIFLAYVLDLLLQPLVVFEFEGKAIFVFKDFGESFLLDHDLLVEGGRLPRYNIYFHFSLGQTDLCLNILLF